jgi:hypothetical protein
MVHRTARQALNRLGLPVAKLRALVGGFAVWDALDGTVRITDLRTKADRTPATAGPAVAPFPDLAAALAAARRWAGVYPDLPPCPACGGAGENVTGGLYKKVVVLDCRGCGGRYYAEEFDPAAGARAAKKMTPPKRPKGAPSGKTSCRSAQTGV